MTTPLPALLIAEYQALRVARPDASVGAEVGLLSFPWFYVADDAFADLVSFCHIPAALWGVGGPVWNARGIVRSIVQILPR
jgi:hypothetical protein